jgi:hypothetical protein
MRRRRNMFRPHPVPLDRMGSIPKAWVTKTNNHESLTDDLATIANWFERQPDSRERFRWALRDSLDELLDGQRTGRWAYQHLSKTEKTYLGTAVEVNLTKEFEIPNGKDLDWRISNIDLDCKFSKDLGSWEIPMEMYLCEDHGERQGVANQPALLTWFNDDTNQWAAGLIVVTDQRLRWRVDKTSGEQVRAYNRDNKRRLATIAAPEVFWLWGGLQTDLPRNMLLHLDGAARDRIFSDASSGQKRIDQLFRETQGRIVGRRTVLTVGQQDDAPKRARDARNSLRDEGILVLGHQESHPSVADALGIPVPVKGEWISVRVVPVNSEDPRPRFMLNGQAWAVAHQNEPIVAAPVLPRRALTPPPESN